MDASQLPSSALEIAALVRRRSLSAAEVTRAMLGVVERRNPEIGAFVELDEQRAIRQAEAIDRRLRGGDAVVGLFEGVPTGIKDNDHLRFHFTRLGSRA